MKNSIWLKNKIKAFSDKLNERPTLKLITINSGWLIGDKLLKLFVGLFVSTWIARYLGPAQYGKLSYAIAFIAIFQTFSMLGLDSIIVRDVARDSVNANKILGTALTLRLFASLLGFVVAGLSISIINPGDVELFVLVLLLGIGIVFQAADIVDLWFQSQSQSRRTVIAKFVSYGIAAIIKVGLIAFGAPLWMFAAALGAETSLSAFALYIAYKKFPVNKEWASNIGVAKKMLKQSFPLLLSGMSIIVYMKSSQLIINELVDSASVGIYSSAQVLSELWYFLPMTIVASVAPVIARKKAESELAYITALKNVFGLMWLASILISVAIALSSELLVTILFGDAYRKAASILSVHIFTLIPVCIGVTQSLWLVNENRSSLALYQSLAGAISSLGLNWILISKYGIIGGAVATVVSQFIQSFAVNILIAPALFRIQVESILTLALKIWEVYLLILKKAKIR